MNLKVELKGLAAAGCATCGDVFKSVAAFDAHRKDGRCVHPQSIGMEKNSRGYWRKPLTESQKEKMYRKVIYIAVKTTEPPSRLSTIGICPECCEAFLECTCEGKDEN